MFVNIKCYSGGTLIYEVNPYEYNIGPNSLGGTLKGLPNSPYSPPLESNEAYVDELVYEVHPTSDGTVPNANGLGLTGETETFHFVLATGSYKDNRIPPKGFDIASASARMAEPVWHGISDHAYFTSQEYTGGCESDFSNVECAIAKALSAGVNMLETGIYTGKGKNITFTPKSTFSAGDSIVIRAYVVDKSTGLPLSNASVDIGVDGLSLSPTSASDANGIAETTWNTSAPNKRGQGGTAPGTYTATVTNVTASGYSWDMVRTSVDFNIQ